jgi:hypothetical protein
VFDAATIGGARALGRDDIGGWHPAAAADIVWWTRPTRGMQPRHDPMRSLIYAAGDRAVKDVYVDGQKVVGDGKVLTMDYAAASAHLHEAQARVTGSAPRRTGRTGPWTRSRRPPSSGCDAAPAGGRAADGVPRLGRRRAGGGWRLARRGARAHARHRGRERLRQVGALALHHALVAHPGRIAAGRVLLEGQDLAALSWPRCAGCAAATSA